MRHFSLLPESERSALFHRQPETFHRDSDRSTLAVALGATLYAPATRPKLTEDIRKQAARGVASMVICLEDAISQADVPAAEYNAIEQLQAYRNSTEEGPLLFVRVRIPEQIVDLTKRLGDAVDVLTGFVLPKFTGDLGKEFLDALAKASANSGAPAARHAGAGVAGARIHARPGCQRCWPTSERCSTTPRARAARSGSAPPTCRRVRAAPARELHGLGRAVLVADAIADIVNVFGRADGTGYVVTGPVWEHFAGEERMFKPQLRRRRSSSTRASTCAPVDRRDLDKLLQRDRPGQGQRADRQDRHPPHARRGRARPVVVTHEE